MQAQSFHGEHPPPQPRQPRMPFTSSYQLGFQFSRASHTTVEKHFVPSLAIDSLQGARSLQQDNTQQFQFYPDLIFVTGESRSAQDASIDAYHCLDGRVNTDRLPQRPPRAPPRRGQARRVLRALKAHPALARRRVQLQRLHLPAGRRPRVARPGRLPRALRHAHPPKDSHRLAHRPAAERWCLAWQDQGWPRRRGARGARRPKPPRRAEARGPS